MPIFKWILFPFAILYRMITGFRNHLYNINYQKSFEFEANVISVGNLSVGGTGKTPMVEYLIRLLNPTFKVATLSRGYGRKTKGFLEVQKGHLAKDVGDEPLQFFLKFGVDVSVNVIEERAWGIPNILMNHEDTDVILLDDAFQHRSVIPSVNLLMTTFGQPFYQDFLLPMGRLRESRRGANRSDIVVVSKCPDAMTKDQMDHMISEIARYTNAPVFFTKTKYGTPIAWYNEGTLPQESPVVLVSAIAGPLEFEEYASEAWQVIKHFQFRDHHKFTGKECRAIAAFAEKHSASIVCTEKDFTKLRDFTSEWRNLQLFYLPIEIEFVNNKASFDQLILGSIRQYKRTGEIDD